MPGMSTEHVRIQSARVLVAKPCMMDDAFSPTGVRIDAEQWPRSTTLNHNGTNPDHDSLSVCTPSVYLDVLCN